MKRMFALVVGVLAAVICARVHVGERRASAAGAAPSTPRVSTAPAETPRKVPAAVAQGNNNHAAWMDEAVPPILPPAENNLARTSLAAVGASGVNGQRELDNEFYGIRNAFDDGGTVRKDGLRYNYWLAEAGDPHPWVEIRFDVPVEMEKVLVEGGPGFRVEIQRDGEFAFVGRSELGTAELERYMAEAQRGQDFVPLAFELRRVDRYVPEKPVTGVRNVRLTFEQRGEVWPVRVNEIQVLGKAPANSKYTAGKPRMFVPRQFADNTARTAFNSWRHSWLEGARPEVVETAETYVITYRASVESHSLKASEIDVLRVTVQKSDGTATMEELVKVVPSK